jgi:hypothetical protein
MTTTTDIAKFRLPKSYQPKTATHRNAPIGRFIKGPIPLEWVLMVAKLPCRSVNIGLALWYLAGLNKSRQVSLTHKTLQEFNVSPKTAGRLLKRMQSAGLVEVVQKPGCSPVVTITVR